MPCSARSDLSGASVIYVQPSKRFDYDQPDIKQNGSKNLIEDWQVYSVDPLNRADLICQSGAREIW
jgi:hypothetical protein